MIGRTRWLWVPTLAAATVNVGLNVLLIPRFGTAAAAVVTAISYGVLLGGVLIARERTAGPRIHYQLGRMVVGILWLAIVGTVAIVAVPRLDDPASLVLRLLAVLLAGAGLVLGAARAGTGWRRRINAAPRSIGPGEPPSDEDLIMASPNG